MKTLLRVTLALITAFTLDTYVYAQEGGAGFSAFAARRITRVVFANLGTPQADAVRYCTDCAATAPCTGSGSGAFAFRTGSTWNCNTGATAVDSTLITGQTAETTADNADLLLIYDNSATALRKMTRANFLSGVGGSSLTSQTLTAGTLTVASNAVRAVTVSTFTWTNGMVTALGAVTSGDIKVATLPAKTVVTNAYIIIAAGGNERGGTLATFTISLGRVGASYIDYIVASDGMTVANYGDTSGERGTNLTGYDLPSWTATTDVYLHFVGDTDLVEASGSAGTVVIVHYTIP